MQDRAAKNHRCKPELKKDWSRDRVVVVKTAW